MIIAVVQARLGSTRFPNKVMRHIGGVPMIELLLERLARSKRIDKVILATTDSPRDQVLAEHVTRLGREVFRGSESDVLDRFYQAVRRYQPTTVVRITGDCPLVDPALVDEVIAAYLSQQVDYLSNTRPATYPDGLDVEVFSYAALEQAAAAASRSWEREHVTPYICESGRFRIGNVAHAEDLSSERWTVDEAVDFEVISSVFGHFHPRTDFGWREVWHLRRMQPQLFQANQHLIRNEGAILSTGQKLCKRAKRVIPGGSMLLSKRPEMFLPDQWPAYFSKAKDCRVWDLDGVEYIDMSIMGIGTNILGYGHPEVDDAVARDHRRRQHVDAQLSRGGVSGGAAGRPAPLGGHGPLCAHRRRGQRHRDPHRARGSQWQGQGGHLRLPRMARLVSVGQSRRRKDSGGPSAARLGTQRRSPEPAGDAYLPLITTTSRSSKSWSTRRTSA